MEREIGTVKWFDLAKRFGFIARSNGEADVFVHISQVEHGSRDLEGGDEVSFELGRNERGFHARNLTIIRPAGDR